MKPKHKMGGTLCNRCSAVITRKHTNQLLCNKCLEGYVNEYPTKNEWGFDPNELKAIVAEFPDINMEKFNLALTGITSIVQEGEIIVYRCDVVVALRAGIEDRDIRLSELD